MMGCVDYGSLLVGDASVPYQVYCKSARCSRVQPSQNVRYRDERPELQASGLGRLRSFAGLPMNGQVGWFPAGPLPGRDVLTVERKKVAMSFAHLKRIIGLDRLPARYLSGGPTESVSYLLLMLSAVAASTPCRSSKNFSSPPGVTPTSKTPGSVPLFSKVCFVPRGTNTTDPGVPVTTRSPILNLNSPLRI